MIEKFQDPSAYKLQKAENKQSAPLKQAKESPAPEAAATGQQIHDRTFNFAGQGKAAPSFSFFGLEVTGKPKAAPAGEPVLKISGIRQGDKFKVDGPAWYDGKAELKKFDSNVLELNINMKATDTFGKTGFKIVNGKINLDIRLQKDGDSYKMITTDNNNGGKKSTQSKLKVEYGKTEGSFFSSGKDFVKISDGHKNGTVFTINSPGNISIKTNAMPVSLDLIKQ